MNWQIFHIPRGAKFFEVGVNRTSFVIDLYNEDNFEEKEISWNVSAYPARFHEALFSVWGLGKETKAKFTAEDGRYVGFILRNKGAEATFKLVLEDKQKNLTMFFTFRQEELITLTGILTQYWTC